MDFTAIDFETANQRRDSACQLAAVVGRGGQLVDRRSAKPIVFRRMCFASAAGLGSVFETEPTVE
jgi:DNA polymerase III epsilon subunit-like protein